MAGAAALLRSMLARQSRLVVPEALRRHQGPPPGPCLHRLSAYSTGDLGRSRRCCTYGSFLDVNPCFLIFFDDPGSGPNAGQDGCY
ncbi:hypothetical protein U9M48_005687 [Paspalum notatum var. saurae]|uniref:Uncharacterized protein n=1 Tax=Paspalum notatum var. saurae TaxID=547442 RepID=A0AAQ3SK69_PASNO